MRKNPSQDHQIPDGATRGQSQGHGSTRDFPQREEKLQKLDSRTKERGGQTHPTK